MIVFNDFLIGNLDFLGDTILIEGTMIGLFGMFSNLIEKGEITGGRDDYECDSKHQCNSFDSHLGFAQ